VTAAPAWVIWLALVTVWVVWGSGYLASRVMIETMPALLGAGARFVLAGAVLLAVAALRHGWRGARATRPELFGALVIGSLISGANAVATVAMTEVPSGLAALLFAALPLWIIVLRLLARERVARATAISMLVGFAGTALVLRPGEQSGDATLLGLTACVGAALMCALGSFALPRFTLPRDLLVSAAWQMLLAGIALELAGVAAGELPDLDLGAFSGRSRASRTLSSSAPSWPTRPTCGCSTTRRCRRSRRSRTSTRSWRSRWAGSCSTSPSRASRSPALRSSSSPSPWSCGRSPTDRMAVTCKRQIARHSSV
jgi:drug/metabolite transporter (DMT)-like permease